MARLLQSLKRWLEGPEKDGHDSKRAATQEAVVWAFVLERQQGPETPTYKLRLPLEKYPCRADIADLRASVKSALERMEVLAPAEIRIFRDNPFHEEVDEHNFQIVYHPRLGADRERPLRSNYLIDEHVDRDSARPFYVLVSELRARQPAMEFVPGPSAAMQRAEAKAEEAATIVAAAAAAAVAAIAPASSIALPPQQGRTELSSQPATVLEGLRKMAETFKDDYQSGEPIPLPRLCVSTPQYARGGGKAIVFRDCFQKIVDQIEVDLFADGQHFRDGRRIFVHGPKGIGKSHALQYAAARLWAKRLETEADAKFRILYIAKWHEISDHKIREELELCFYDDPGMLATISVMQITPNNVQALLERYNEQRLVMIVDQVFDQTVGNEGGRASNMFAYFPRPSMHCRLVFASSPRFDLQGLLLAGESELAIPVAFMDQLTNFECSVVAKQLSEEMQAPTDVAQALRKVVKDRLYALPNSAEELEHLIHEAKNLLEWSNNGREGKKTAQLDERQQAAVTLLHFMEVSGGVPLYLRQIFLTYLPEADSIEAASEAFSANCAKDVRMNSFTHYVGLRASPDPLTAKLHVNSLLNFLQRAIGHGKIDETRVRLVWQARDLRYVRLCDDRTVVPLCPAALHGLVHFMLEVALTTETEQRDSLLGQLRTALKVPGLAPQAAGFLKEGIFLQKLSGKRDVPVHATRSSDANPDPRRAEFPEDHPDELVFEFNRVDFVDTFADIPPGTKELSATGARALLLPRDPCEQYIDALYVNYAEKLMVAIQVTGQRVMQHQDSLNFFREESDHRWQNMTYSNPQEWTKAMIWVLTNKDEPSQPWPDDTEVYQYQIDYDTFVSDGTETIHVKQPRRAKKRSAKSLTQAAGKQKAKAVASTRPPSEVSAAQKPGKNRASSAEPAAASKTIKKRKVPQGSQTAEASAFSTQRPTRSSRQLPTHTSKPERKT